MSKNKKDQFRPPEDAIWFLPLGGSGEIGMNLNLYGTAGKWLMVDCGVTFGDEHTPGIDLIMPDISFIEERRDDLVAIVLTHGHEDHLGAVEHLWPYLQCPVYATPFTARLLRSKLNQSGLQNRVRVIEIPTGGGFELGPFKVDFVQITHSIPEAQMVALSTQIGTVLHTGDWKLDPTPVIGDLSNESRLQALGQQNVLAIVGDSTNATLSGHSGSEIGAQTGLCDVLQRYSNRIAVTCFASNIARIKSIAIAAQKVGRSVALAGRSLWRNAEIAFEVGYLPEFESFLSESEAMQSPRDKVVIVCTGCQGEPRSALARMASYDHPEIELEAGDAVIFSSRDIPGNEKEISKLQNLLIKQGIDVLPGHHADIHVSGHPYAGEVAQLYNWVKPRLSVPVHGELRHQNAHAQIALDCGIPATIIPANGQIIRLGPGVHEVVAEVKFGKLGLDGKILRPIDRETIKSRKKMSYSGAVVVTLALDDNGQITHDPQLSLLGLEDEAFQDALRQDLSDQIRSTVSRLPRSSRSDNAALKNAVVQTVRRYLNENYGKKPVVEVHLLRV